VFGLVDLHPSALDVFDHQLEDVDDLEFLEGFGKPVLQTKPGRIIGVASLG
jgi:hypothetical protein